MGSCPLGEWVRLFNEVAIQDYGKMCGQNDLLKKMVQVKEVLNL